MNTDAPGTEGGAELRVAAEAASVQRRAPAAASQPLTPEATQALLHELQVHQIELEMQNTELRRTQAETDTWRSHYFDIYELAPLGYCTVSESGLVVEANLALASMLGVPRTGLVGRPLARFMLTDGQNDFYLLCREALQGTMLEADGGHAPSARAGAASSLELTLSRPDGSRLWAQCMVTVAAQHSIDVISPKHAGERRLSMRKVLRVVVIDIQARKQAQLDLLGALREKEALLREVHHRVKNNLQVISSLLRLEGGRSVQPETQTVVDAMRARIRAMAMLHESLYRTDNFAAVDLAVYLRELSVQAFNAQLTRPGAIALQVDLASVSVTMEQAMPCGLMVSELISNSLKHGFPDGRAGAVRVSLQPGEAPAWWRLGVSDTGVGLPPDFDAKRQASLGLQLAGDLAEQIGGVLQVNPNLPSGAEFWVGFKVA